MNKKRLNSIFIIYVVLIVLTISGVLPRYLAPLISLALAIYFVICPLEEVVLFFVRSIPFFIAIPLTASFDSLNIWRILSIIIFLRWLNLEKLKQFFNFSKQKVVYLSSAILLVLAIISITQATDPILSIKRIILFINLSLIGIVIHDFVARDRGFGKKLIPNIAIPAILVAFIGMIQLVSTYFMDIFQFIDFWGNVVERNLFGNAWADIALKANTWFAYFGDQLSLRVFSIFPDSHSFPIFLILGIPVILAISLDKIIASQIGFKNMQKTRARMRVLYVPMVLLLVILSGTRGIWAAGLGSVILAVLLIFWFRRRGIDSHRLNTFKYVVSYLSIFFILFALAYPIFGSPQFNLFKSSGSLLSQRFHSIIDFGETSNSRRIQIWKDSLKSIIRHPVLGIGIGNFPVVVGEDLVKIKAGSSAHNLYLNIAAEMGIPALLVSLYFFWLLLKKCYENFRSETDPVMLIFFAASLIFISWNLMYSLTDVAIFDERAFLLFMVTVGLIFGNKAIKNPD